MTTVETTTDHRPRRGKRSFRRKVAVVAVAAVATLGATACQLTTDYTERWCLAEGGCVDPHEGEFGR